MRRPRGGRLALVLLLVAAAVALAADFIRRSEALPAGPVDVVWDRTACAECRMTVSERAYAAQLQLKDGRVLDFDDAGCLFRFQAHDGDAPHATYFRAVHGDGWLPAGKAAFVRAGPSPMGYDLGAVPAGTPDSFSVAEARALVVGDGGGAAGEGGHAR